MKTQEEYPDAEGRGKQRLEDYSIPPLPKYATDVHVE